MSAQSSNPAPEPGARESQQPVENQVGRERAFVDAHLPIDPQQQFREYTSPGRGTTPARPLPPAYPVPGSYQPGNAGQVAGAPNVYQPGNGEQVTGVPGVYQPGYTPYAAYPGQVPGAWPGYPPYAFYPGQTPGVPGQMPYYPGYNPYAPYAGYPGYGYAWPMVPVQPKRDTYSLVVAIAAFACSCLVILGGLGSLAIMGLFSLAASTTVTLSGSTFFASVFLLLTMAIAGLVGGGFCTYHSMRSLFFRKASRAIWLPRFWIFLLCYLATIGVGFGLHAQGLDISSPALTGVLIYLGGIFPALTIMALGIRRLSFPRVSRQAGSGQRWRLAQMFRRSSAPRVGQWPTSWRRLTLALVSGATLSIILASLLELVLELIMIGSTQSNTVSQYISDPNSGNPPPALFGLLLIMLSVIAPLVEELVKPLAVVVLIGRVRNKAEAFTLGLACGIGFNLVETAGYISSGYNDWLNVALVRSGAGLLHGFGAAMVALGWYYLTHKEEGAWLRRTLLAFGCGGYAVLQHALWNGSVGLMFIPGPIGGFFQNWSWGSGPFVLGGIELVNIVEVIAILIFFVYMSGRLRVGAEVQKRKRKGMQPVESASLVPAQGII